MVHLAAAGSGWGWGWEWVGVGVALGDFIPCITCTFTYSLQTHTHSCRNLNAQEFLGARSALPLPRQKVAAFQECVIDSEGRFLETSGLSSSVVVPFNTHRVQLKAFHHHHISTAGN